MRVVTTVHKEGFDQYGHRWLEGRKFWPKGTEFWFYTEGFDLPADGMVVRDLMAIEEFATWKRKYGFYTPPGWQWDVVKYAHKVFAAIDALMDYDGIGVWLDADCVTFAQIPEGLIEAQVKDDYIAHYGRTGMYTETGMWIVNCAHEQHKNFCATWKDIYHAEQFKNLPQWHDCMTLDATIRAFTRDKLITTHNLSGEHHKAMHPQAKTEFGQYIDHCKGPRKMVGASPENTNRQKVAA